MGLLDWVRLYTATLIHRRDASRLTQISLGVSTLWMIFLVLPYIPRAAELPRISGFYRFATATLPLIPIRLGTIVLMLVPPLMGALVTAFDLFREQHGYLPRTPTETGMAFSYLSEEPRDASLLSLVAIVLRGLSTMFHWLGVSLLLMLSALVGALRALAGAPPEDVFFIPGRPQSLEGLADALSDGLRTAGSPPLYLLLSSRPEDASSTFQRLAVRLVGKLFGPVILLKGDGVVVLATSTDITAMGEMARVRTLFIATAPLLRDRLCACEHPLAAELERALNSGQTTTWNELVDLLAQDGVTLGEVAVLADKATGPSS